MADGRSSFANERPFTRRGVVEACKRAERAQEAEPQWAWRLRKRTGKRAFKRAGQRSKDDRFTGATGWGGGECFGRPVVLRAVNIGDS